MFGEFALDPQLFADEGFVQVLLHTTGMDHGRLLSDCPKHWETRAKKAIKESVHRDIKQRSLARALDKICRSAMIKNPYRPRSNGEWSEAVLNSAAIVPFSAMVTTNADEHFVSAEGIKNNECEAWAIKADADVHRVASDIVGNLLPLLRLAKKAAIVDPYFILLNRRGRFDVVLYELLKACEDMPQLTSLIIHTEAQEPQFAGRQLGNNRELVQAKLTIRWCKWADKQLHDRYLVTDVGSIKLGHGFDAKKNPDGSVTDKVHMQRVPREKHQDNVTRYLIDIDLRSVVLADQIWPSA